MSFRQAKIPGNLRPVQLSELQFWQEGNRKKLKGLPPVYHPVSNHWLTTHTRWFIKNRKKEFPLGLEIGRPVRVSIPWLWDIDHERLKVSHSPNWVNRALDDFRASLANYKWTGITLSIAICDVRPACGGWNKVDFRLIQWMHFV